MIIDGKKVANKIKEDLKKEVSMMQIPPTLAVVQVGDDPASNSYIKAKEKGCSEVGINFKHLKFKDDINEDELILEIVKLNNDKLVDGILVQLPLPNNLDENKVLNTINKDKDVDGLTTINAGCLFQNNITLAPCTPLGIIKLLEEYNISLEGKHVVIVGRSNLVSKPLAMLLLEKNATVTICHSKSINLEKYTKEADILISSVGKKHLIRQDMVKDNAVVIDVGISRDNTKLYGDVDFDNVIKKASYITPTPGGVGPMTVAMLLSNVVKAKRRLCNDKY